MEPGDPWAQPFGAAYGDAVSLPRDVRDAVAMDLDVSPLDFPDVGISDARTLDPRLRIQMAGGLLPVTSWDGYDRTRWWREPLNIAELKALAAVDAGHLCASCKSREPITGKRCEVCRERAREHERARARDRRARRMETL